MLRFGSDELSADPGRIADEAYLRLALRRRAGDLAARPRRPPQRHRRAAAAARPSARCGLADRRGGELQTTSPLRKAFEASPRAAAVPVFQVEGDESRLADPRRRERSRRRRSSRTALELLADTLGGDRLAIRGELEKLFLYAAAAVRHRRRCRGASSATPPSSQTDELIDAALLGDSEALETGLARMRAEGARPPRSARRRSATSCSCRRCASPWMRASVASAVERARPPVFGRRAEGELSRPSRFSGAPPMDEAVYLTRRSRIGRLHLRGTARIALHVGAGSRAAHSPQALHDDGAASARAADAGRSPETAAYTSKLSDRSLELLEAAVEHDHLAPALASSCSSTFMPRRP